MAAQSNDTLSLANEPSTPSEAHHNGAVSTAPLSRRYQIMEPLGKGGMGFVYRAFDRIENRFVAIKRVITRAQEGSTRVSTSVRMDNRFNLAMEFQALAALWHPHIVHVIDYGFDADQQPYFTMELLENAEPITYASLNKSPDEKLDLLLQMLYALAYLHRRQIIHRDLKPSNVLVVNDVVKVLDFGLSVTAERANVQAGMLGTLAYMAPEMLREAAPTIASDLYSAGVIAYEMFAGQHPFDTFSVDTLMGQIDQAEPNLDVPEIPARLRPILRMMLAKQPEDRYQDPRAVIEALQEAFDRSIILETSATRESFLQAAIFVGRELEMTRLTAALEKMLDNEGSAWLVAGPGGIGKSRLLAELRTRAMIRGAIALRSQMESEYAAPYQIWQSIVRWLAVTVDFTDLEASVLKPVVPDIATLVSRPVADAPELDPPSAQTRLFFTMEGVLMRVQQPLVIILEDIHNAGTESIALLGWLTRLANHLPLMFICSYRDDERPTLHESLPGAELIKLGPLEQTDIHDLMLSMLGPGGGDRSVQRLLVQKTSGNAFFLIEVARALAEEVGELSNVTRVTIPHYLVSGNIDAIIERRLNQVGPEDQPLLEIAAVTGRILDLSLLSDLATETDLDAWLERCASSAVLAVQSGQWRFAHDKLREKLLAKMAPDHRVDLHRKIAQALETLKVSAAVLSYHWAQAGDTLREKQYAAQAGDDALRLGAYPETILFLTRAIALESETTDTARHRKGRWLITLGKAYFNLGNFSKSVESYREALVLLGMPEPTTRGGYVRSILAQFFTQIGHRVRRLHGVITPRDATENERLIDIARAYREITEIYYFRNSMFETLSTMVTAMNVAERATPSTQLAQSYAAMVVLCGLLRFHAGARMYSRLAVQTAQHIGDPLVIAHTRQRVSIYSIGVGDWDMARKDYEEGIAIFDQLGERPARGLSQGALAAVLKYQGHLQESLSIATHLFNEAVHRGDMLLQANGISALMSLSLRLGDLESVLKYSKLAQSIIDKEYNQNTDLRNIGLLGLYYARLENYGLARQQAERGLAIAAKMNPAVYATVEGFTSLPELFVLLYEAASDDEGRKSTLKQLERALRALWNFARRFTFARPVYYIYMGSMHWLANNPQQARRFWDRGLAMAESLKMPYELAMGHFEVGRHLPADDAAREDHLRKALSEFERIGARLEATRVQTVLRTKQALSA